ncbi:MAG: alkaline phosphatase family protein [Planctomycetes bacterium]|nr:alkaline phosphatase family protein [Planctomycetota bacterium]
MQWLAALVALVFGFTIKLAQAEPHRDQCVVLISVDGLAGFYLDDPRAEMPTIRRMAREGARASGMVCSFPTVTWPNHTTLVTGVPPEKHGVLGNNYLERASGSPVALIVDPVYDKDQIVSTPTIYDVAHRAGLTTAGICWPATRNARTLNWSMPDMAGDGWEKYGTQAWLSELRGAGLPVDMHGAWCKEPSGGVRRDWLYTRMAAQVLKQHSPNVLIIHLVEVDHVEHKYGPRSPEAYWAVSFADDRVRDIVEAVQASPLGKKTTVIVASDHGFFPIDKDIRPNVVLAAAGLLNKDTKRAAIVSQGGACMVYVLDDKDRPATIEQLKTKFAGVEGVDRVFTAAEFAALGVATPAADERAPDLWLAAKRGYSFTDSRDGDAPVVPRASPGGTHGYLPGEAELFGTCVLWGHGVRPGTNLGEISNTDVAPTMGALLGVEIPGATGKVLRQGLSD